MKKMTSEQFERFSKNMLKFTAPALAIFFAQLATGVDFKSAFLVAVFALYGLLSDYFKKISE